MRSVQTRLLLVFVMCIICATVLFGQAPMMINYQGKLLDTEGNPLNATPSIVFKIFNAESGGDELWSETHLGVQVTAGFFNVTLGSVTPLEADDFSGSGNLYLEMTIAGEKLSDRFLLTSVAYAIHANEADAVAADAISTINIQNGAVTQEKLADGITAVPAGPAGGDLAGDFPNVTVKSINGRGVSAAAPDAGQVLKWNGTSNQWEPSVDESGGTINTTARLTGDGTAGKPLDLAPQGATTDQVLKWNGTAWAPGVDVSGGTVNTTARLTGDGTAGSPLDLARNGASNNQVLQWNGTAWVPGTITVSGGNTLDQAYDQGGAGVGRTITADKGAVNIAGSDGLTVEGAVTAAAFTGSGTGLTGLVATNIASGVLKTSVLDDDLQDLADGSLTGSKVGTGIDATNITAGTISDARLETTIDRTIFNASDYVTAQGGIHAGGTGDPGTDNLWVDGMVGIGTSGIPRYPVDILAGTNTRSLFLDHNQTSNLLTTALEIDLDKTDGGNSGSYGILSRTTNTGGTGFSIGLYGSADGTSTGTKYGVYGYAGGSGTLYAGYFQGDVYVATNLGIGVTSPVYGITMQSSSYVGTSVGFINPSTSYDDWHITLSNSSIYFAHSTDNLATYGTDKYQMTAAAFYPRSSTLTLGTSGFRWAAVYAVNGTIQTSDKRLKKNISPLKYGLKDLLKINPVSFEWKDGEGPEGKRLGLIAQDVIEVIPEAVNVSGPDSESDKRTKLNAKGEKDKEIIDNIMGINYSDLVPVLIQSIKEQQQLIADLQNRLEKLESK